MDVENSVDGWERAEMKMILLFGAAMPLILLFLLSWLVRLGALYVREEVLVNQGRSELSASLAQASRGRLALIRKKVGFA